MSKHLKELETVRTLGNYRLAVVWRDGRSAIIDLTPDVKSGGVWSGLQEAEKFAQARIGRRGRTVEWPEPADSEGDPLIDIDADALYEIARQQRVQPLVDAVLDHLQRHP